jgi:ABC-type glutathione transport system ATPase component
MNGVALRFDSVTLTAHAQGSAVEILRRVSFAVGEGRILGLVGESGAGKSMIGRVISGILPENLQVSSGQVRFGDPTCCVSIAAAGARCSGGASPSSRRSPCPDQTPC